MNDHQRDRFYGQERRLQSIKTQYEQNLSLFVVSLSITMAAEDSERLARRLQAEEDKLTELILHEATDEALARRLHEKYQLEASTKADPDAPISLLSETTLPNRTPNSVTNAHKDIESDEALARLLQAEEEQNAKALVHGEGSAGHRSPPSPSSSQLKSDEEFARLLQEQEGQEADNSLPNEQINNDLELFSPTPDIHALFQMFDEQYFYGMLKVVEVIYGSRDFFVQKKPANSISNLVLTAQVV
jgi:hypothetical protein